MTRPYSETLQKLNDVLMNSGLRELECISVIQILLSIHMDGVLGQMKKAGSEWCFGDKK